MPQEMNIVRLHISSEYHFLILHEIIVSLSSILLTLCHPWEDLRNESGTNNDCLLFVGSRADVTGSDNDSLLLLRSGARLLRANDNGHRSWCCVRTRCSEW